MTLWTSAILGTAVLVVASAQQYSYPPAGPPEEAAPAPQSCVPPPPPPSGSGCACGNAQPISIQLSCGGGGNRRPGGSRPPPPPPPQYTTADYYTTEASWPMSPFDNYDMSTFCTFDSNGFPDPAFTPPGGFPEGFRMTHDANGYPQMEVAPLEQRPPPNWDGSAATLGFPMPPI